MPQAGSSSVSGGPILFSTPQSRGSSHISRDIDTTGLNTEIVRPWIKRDVDNARQCSFDVMLKDFLSDIWSSTEQRPNSDTLLESCLHTVLTVCNDKSEYPLRMKEQLTQYSSDLKDDGGNTRPKSEVDMYDNFVLAANYALLSLESIDMPGFSTLPPPEDRILFQSHYGTAIKAVHGRATSTLKPDLVVLSVGDARRAHSDQGDAVGMLDYHLRLATEMPEKQGVCWHGIRTIVEMKKGRRKHEKVADEYVMKEHSVPRKEYITRFRHSGPESRSTTVSQGDDVLPIGSSNKKRKKLEDSDNVSQCKRRKYRAEQVRDLTAQTGNYAAELMSSHIGRSHALTLVVDGDVLYLLRFDREGVIECSGLNFIVDLPRFLLLLFAMQRFKNHHWGINRDMDSRFGPAIEDVSVLLDTEQGKIKLGLHVHPKRLNSHFGLNGRATNVLPAELADEDGLVAKICWPEESRTPEPDIIAKAKNIDEEGVLKHLPEVIVHHTFEHTSTARIRERLGLAGNTIDGCSGSRVLRLIVFRKLRPITELCDGELVRAWWHGVTCHRIVWNNGIRHRDVSPPNLMYRRDEDGTVIGVLNDFDLATLTDRPTGNERTGTMPFMALNLLEDEAMSGEVKHLYEHDAESFVWVLLWIFVRYEKGKLLEDPPLNSWLGISARECRKEKSTFLFHSEWKKVDHGNGGNGLIVGQCMNALRLWYLQDIDVLRPVNMDQDDGSRARTAYMELLQGPHNHYLQRMHPDSS